MRTPRQTAVLIAVMLKRAGQNRVRISERTVKMLAGARHLRSSFVVDLMEAVAEFSWSMFELDRGGFGLIETKALDSAKSVLTVDCFKEAELNGIKRGVINFAKFEEELRPAHEEEEDIADDKD